jgi:single-strand DNA-binding protein
MKLIGLARIGKDVELRYTPKGDPVANISAAWNYGMKDQSGKKPTQWVDAALFGKRAESLAPFLKKGTSIVLDLNDVHVEVFNGKNGPNHKLCGKVENLWFAGTPKEEASAPKRAPTLMEEESDLPF